MQHGSSPLPLPRRVRELVTGRLERLSDPARQLARVAAVIGREFDFPLVQRAAGLDDSAAAQAVEELVRRHIFRGTGRVSTSPTTGFAPPPTPSSSHPGGSSSIAEWARRSRRSTPLISSPTPSALGVHFRQGEVWDKAVRYLRQAGATAYARGGLREARDIYFVALELCPRLDPTPDNLGLSIDVRLDLDVMLLGLGDLARIPRLHREADEIAARLGDQPRRGPGGVPDGSYAWLQTDYEAAITLSRRAIDIAESTGNTPLRVHLNPRPRHDALRPGPIPRDRQYAPGRTSRARTPTSPENASASPSPRTCSPMV